MAWVTTTASHSTMDHRPDDMSVYESAARPRSPTSQGVVFATFSQSVVDTALDKLTMIAGDAVASSDTQRDAQWRLLETWIRPYEEDRSAYRSSKYERPVVVSVEGFLWRNLVSRTSVQFALDLFLLFGFAPIPTGEYEGIHQWAEMTSKEDVDDIRFRFLLSDDSQRPSAMPVLDRSGLAPWVGGRADDVQRPPIQISSATPSARDEMEATEKIRELENEVRELTKQLRLLKSREVQSQREGSLPHQATNSYAASTLSGGGESPHQAMDAVLRAQGSPASSHPPVPQTILPAGRSLVASTSGGSIVCLPFNYLDPDAAPFVVSVAMGAQGFHLIPCSVVEHRFVLFVAPPHPRGSLAVTVLCTREGSLRRYAKSVWLEYRPPESTKTVLSYHAVNQLMQDVPLPSSATLADPSENATELKSEDVGSNALEDELFVGDADNVSDNGSVGTVGGGVEPQHLPLTREMLEMIQPYSVLGSAVAAANPHSPHLMHHMQSSSRPSIPPSECSETVASSIALTQGASLVEGAGAASLSIHQDMVSVSAISCDD